MLEVQIKDLGHLSQGIPVVIYKLSMEFEISKIKSPKIVGIKRKKESPISHEHISLPCATRLYFLIGHARLHT
jgi:hypothetical protein